jgi:hypothetical protein
MYWNNTNTNTLDISQVGAYKHFPHMSPTNLDGYNCDPLGPTPILFLGSCDLDGPIKDTNQSWARLLHADLSLDAKKGQPLPYIAMGKMTAGFMAFPRRLNTFCEKFGPPNKLFAVIPRPAAVEIPLSTGELVSVSNRHSFADFLKKHGRISDIDYNSLANASKFFQTQLHNETYQLYQFEQSASFLALICKHYKIDFRWTMNLSASAIAYYQIYFTLFMANCPFMLENFIGTAIASDFSFDGSMGDKSQHQIADLFIQTKNSRGFDMEETISLLNINLNLANSITPKVHRAL